MTIISARRARLLWPLTAVCGWAVLGGRTATPAVAATPFNVDTTTGDERFLPLHGPTTITSTVFSFAFLLADNWEFSRFANPQWDAGTAEMRFDRSDGIGAFLLVDIRDDGFFQTHESGVGIGRQPTIDAALDEKYRQMQQTGGTPLISTDAPLGIIHKPLGGQPSGRFAFINHADADTYTGYTFVRYKNLYYTITVFAFPDDADAFSVYTHDIQESWQWLP